jgi:hypothetical protein
MERGHPWRSRAQDGRYISTILTKVVAAQYFTPIGYLVSSNLDKVMVGVVFRSPCMRCWVDGDYLPGLFVV